MRAPGFWYRAPSLASAMLSPLGALYAAGTARRLFQGAHFKPGVPVICVGNINIGGTGKTPTVIALAQRLQARGKTPAILSRGYGGRKQGPHKVDERKDSAGDVGDEPLLLSAFAPTWIARDRMAGAKQAVSSGADVILMDDGFQSGALNIDLALVVVDAGQGFGNNKCLPAGPLREPVARGLGRADMILSIGPDAAQDHFAQSGNLPPALPHLKGRLEPLQTGMDWAGLRVLAFAGIGNPEKFFATLRGLGADVVETHALADHQPLDARLLQRLTRRAEALGARLVSTEKDAVRLPNALRSEVLTLPVRLHLDDWAQVDGAFADLGL